MGCGLDDWWTCFNSQQVQKTFLSVYTTCWTSPRYLFMGYLGLIPGTKQSELEGCQCSVEVKKAWSCLHLPISFIACAGIVRPLLLPTVLYCFISQRNLLCRKVLAATRSGIRAGLFWSSSQTFIDTTLQGFGKNGGFVSAETRLMSNSQHALHPGISGGIRYKKNLNKLFLD
jgi:hypothetical protein